MRIKWVWECFCVCVRVKPIARKTWAILITAQTGQIGIFHFLGKLLFQPKLISGLLEWYNGFIMHAKGQHDK